MGGLQEDVWGKDSSQGSKVKRKVLVACCNGKGWIHKRVMFAIMRMAQDRRHQMTFIAPTHSPFVQNLHKTVNEFLERGDDFLLLIDDDNPPKGNPLDLVELDLDVLGFPTPVWHNGEPGDRPYYANAMRAVSEGDGVLGFRPLDSYPGFKEVGIQECDAVGTGCVLIARRVLVELMERAKGNPSETPFMRIWNDRGEVIMGNDFAFCTRVKKAGFSIWAHFDYECEHHNELELGEVIRAFSMMHG